MYMSEAQTKMHWMISWLMGCRKFNAYRLRAPCLKEAGAADGVD